MNEITRFYSFSLSIKYSTHFYINTKKILALLKRITSYWSIPYLECFWIAPKIGCSEWRIYIVHTVSNVKFIQIHIFIVNLLFLLWFLLHRTQKLHQFSLVFYVMNCYLSTNFRSFFSYYSIISFLFWLRKKIICHCQTSTSTAPLNL